MVLWGIHIRESIRAFRLSPPRVRKLVSPYRDGFLQLTNKSFSSCSHFSLLVGLPFLRLFLCFDTNYC